MKRTGMLLTLLASTILVFVVACGGKHEAPQVQRERTVVVPAPQPAPPPAPGQVVSRETVTTEVVRDRTTPAEMARGVTQETRELIAQQPPPPLRQEAMTMPPSSAYVWVPGYWTWNNGWQWTAGHWELPPQRMTTWVPGQWVPQGQNWVWRPGLWQ